MRTSRRIRSGNFSVLNPHNRQSAKLSSTTVHTGTLGVDRTYIPSTYDTNSETVSIEFNLSYQIHNPKLLSLSVSENDNTKALKAPIILVHGGPGIPSDYLIPLTECMKQKDRCVITYDQIGCGESNEPSDINAYSIDYAVDDLEKLIYHLNLKKFHLCGHSFGGILAFELVKRFSKKFDDGEDEDNVKSSNVSSSRSFPRPECLSLILSSTPFNVHEVDKCSERILQSMQEDNRHKDLSAFSSFEKTHVCRTDQIPPALQDAYLKRGKVWQGTEVIQDYIASKNAKALLSRRTPLLLMRGEFDFVSQTQALDQWEALWSQLNGCDTQCEMTILDGCSHYGMLEDCTLYCNTVEAFLCEIEPNLCENQ